MELDTVLEHLLVLGGGYIGLEFGQMFRRFGSSVRVLVFPLSFVLRRAYVRTLFVSPSF